MAPGPTRPRSRAAAARRPDSPAVSRSSKPASPTRASRALTSGRGVGGKPPDHVVARPDAEHLALGSLEDHRGPAAARRGPDRPPAAPCRASATSARRSGARGSTSPSRSDRRAPGTTSARHSARPPPPPRRSCPGTGRRPVRARRGPAPGRRPPAAAPSAEPGDRCTAIRRLRRRRVVLQTHQERPEVARAQRRRRARRRRARRPAR